MNIDLEEQEPLNTTEFSVNTPEDNYNFFSWQCLKSILIYHLILASSMFLLIILTVYTDRFIFRVLSAIIPGAIIIEFCRYYYNKYITRCQMTVTIIETMFLIPIVGLFTTFLENKLLIGNNLIYDISVTSFILAGLIEETIKFIPLIRIINSKFITNPRSMWVYGLCAGAGFACLENISYVLMGGVRTSIIRSILSVPLHCCTGLIMGMNMSIYKFRDQIEADGIYQIKYYKAVFLPIIIHGLFDFLLMIGETINISGLFFLAIIELFVTYIYLRYFILKLEKEFMNTEDIHDMIEDKRLEPPCVWFIH